MLAKDKILNVLCQFKLSQNSEIQPKMESLGHYWPSVKCSDGSVDQRNQLLLVLLIESFFVKEV